MSNNFAEVAQTLQSTNPAAFAKLQMLSISLDPEFDDPKVLRAYGKTYAGAVDPKPQALELRHRIAGGDSQEPPNTSVSPTRQQNGQVIHNLRTALLDANGKISELYLGNQWKPADRGRPASGIAEVARAHQQLNLPD